MAAAARRGSTAGKSIVPYCAMLLDNCAGLWFSTLIGDVLSVRLRLTGLLLNLAYLAVMITFAPRRGEAVRKVALTVGAMVAFYAAMSGWVPPKVRPDVLGLVNTGTALAFASSPLAGIRDVLKRRDASSIPFAMVATLTLCATSWATYGVVLGNVWMVIPNVCNAVIGGAQVALSLALRSGPSPARSSVGEVAGAGKASRLTRRGGGARGSRSRGGVTSPPGQGSSQRDDLTAAAGGGGDSDADGSESDKVTGSSGDASAAGRHRLHGLGHNTSGQAAGDKTE
jgi:uncharacterized protein with PQ loop repeat